MEKGRRSDAVFGVNGRERCSGAKGDKEIEDVLDPR
jgi:hypothetical protein